MFGLVQKIPEPHDNAGTVEVSTTADNQEVTFVKQANGDGNQESEEVSTYRQTLKVAPEYLAPAQTSLIKATPILPLLEILWTVVK